MRKPVSRRSLLKASAGLGAALASNFAAPAILAQTKAPIRLGNLNSFSGTAAYIADTNMNGMSLYFDSINWTVAGRKIEVIKEDDQFNPQVGLQKAKKLVEGDNVDMVIGVQGSNVALAVLNYMKQQKAFYVVTSAGADAITWDRYPYLFRTSLSTFQLSNPIASWMYDNLAKEIVTVVSDYAGGRDVVAPFKQEFTRKGGKLAKEIWPPLGTTDFSAYIVDLKSINPGATYSFMPGADGIRFIRQYDEFGLSAKSPLAGFAMINAQAMGALGKTALNMISAQSYVDSLDNAENKAFVAAYQAKFGAPPDYVADYGWVAGRALAEALKAVDGDTSNKDKLAEAMEKVSFNAPRGPFRIDPETHNPIQNTYICQVVEVDGKITSKVLGTTLAVKDPGKKTY